MLCTIFLRKIHLKNHKMKNLKVVYSYIDNQVSKEMVNHMKIHHQCEPSIIIGKRKITDWVKLNYPSSYFIDTFELSMGRTNYQDIGNKKIIDQKIIQELSPYQANFMGRLRDSNGFNFSFKQRLEFYYDILNYWNTVILNFKPDIFISYTWPHVQSDYPLYLMCKYIYKIPCIFLDSYPYFENRYAIMSDYDNLSQPFKKKYNYKNIIINDAVKNYINEIRINQTEKTPTHMINYFKYKNKQYLFFNKVKIFFKFIGSLINLTILQKAIVTDKVNKQEWGEKSQMNNLNHFFFKLKLHLKPYYLKFLYKKKIKKNVNFNNNYFYFAAPYQPEASSSIPPGIYENLYYTLTFICSLLPEGTYLYYKEHPSIFKSSERGALGRDKEYYSKISRIKNIYMVDTNTDNYKLIENSIATISISGSTAWQSLIKLKPTIILGNHAVSGCNSVLTVSNAKELEECINIILSGKNIDQEDVKKYLQAVYDSTIPDLKIITNRTKNEFNMDFIPKGYNDIEIKKICDGIVSYYKDNFFNKIK